ncbi:AAA family ATPase [Actinoplanes hulinensis]|uniref:AAA family ATPase n=1 Tax=Actinoplanes hulinensis TaxID=1144547 RepID=A0ABS7AYK8_9ACTN|nr:LuxR family transcriptional regulator [Actinoplanes hulinensis]MBW6433830.1 AAA family ATPase [Actinoplanes hulinensis]
MALQGRAGECGTLREFIRALHGGLGDALVLVGDPGSGKTALLEEAVTGASGLRVIRVTGVEAESGFPYAALHRLLIPVLPLASTYLPPDGLRALHAAFGLVDDPPTGPEPVVRAVAALLGGLAVESPVLCCADDAHWFDRESLAVLAAVARRLPGAAVAVIRDGRTAARWAQGGRAGVGLIVAAREMPAGWGRFPVLEVAGLGAADGAAVLRSVVAGPLDALVAARLVAGTGGNPLALIDLGRELSADQLAGAQSLPDPLSAGSRIEEFHLRRVRELPDDTRTWLLIAAAEPGGDIARIAAAADRLGIAPGAPGPAVAAGILTLGVTAVFRRPLARSAIYSGATGDRRRAVHAALAAVTGPADDADQQAWHLAGSCAGLDETVARALVGAADRAGERGGYAARAAFLTRAAELTPGAGRAERFLDAAEAALVAGAPLQARRLADAALEANTPSPVRRPARTVLEAGSPPPDRQPRDVARDGEVEGLRARQVVGGRAMLVEAGAVVMSGRAAAYAEGSLICLEAARAIGESEPRLARGALLEAVEHLIRAGNAGPGTGLAEIAEAAARPPSGRGTARVSGAAEVDGAAVVEQQLRAFGALVAEGCAAAVPEVRRAVGMLLAPNVPDDVVLRRHLTAATLSALLWDPGAERAVWRLVVRTARRSGARFQLVTGLYGSADAAARLGDVAAVRESLAEAERVCAEIGVDPRPDRLAEGAVAQALGRGDYRRARVLAGQVVAADVLGVHGRVLPDLVEAAVRSGDPETAGSALARFTGLAEAAGTGWALGVLAWTRALVAGAGEAEPLYRRAVALLAGTGARADLARAHLLYGEWLRRRRRRRDARDELRRAASMFEALGARGYAERAARELDAAEGTGGGLTPQELTIARLAAAGATNGEIAARLFLSANTVDHHLRKVFRKLDVTSRRRLPPV